MADTKITALAAITTVDPAADVLPIVDVSDTSMAASGTTKKITSNQILGAGGTATLASATITGDLTVDTSTLKVDSANNRVGIGLTSPNRNLSIYGASNSLIHFTTATTGPLNTDGFTFGVETDSSVALFNSENTPFNFYVNSTLGMTLNSTGLGVGGSPSAKLDVNSASITDTDLKYNLIVRSSDSYTTSPKSGIAFASFFNGSSNLPLCGIFGGKENGTINDFASAVYIATRSNGGNITTRLTVDSSGNVGVGVTPSAWQSGLKAIQFAANGVLYGNGTNSAFFGNNYYTDSGGTNRYIVSNAALAYGQTAGAHQWFIAPAGTAGNAITFTQAMTLTASGELLVGTTSQIRGGKLSVDSSAGVASGLKSSAGSSVFVEELWNTGSLDNSFINFGTDSTFTARGSITYNRSGGLVAYNTTSDYRAKDIIGPVSNSGSVIDSLKVYIGKMKGASVERPMLVAHEAQIVAPYSVTGQKDEVDADGNPKYQQMDVSSFVPLLIAEIQSLRTRVQTLEAR